MYVWNECYSLLECERRPTVPRSDLACELSSTKDLAEVLQVDYVGAMIMHKLCLGDWVSSVSANFVMASLMINIMGVVLIDQREDYESTAGSMSRQRLHAKRLRHSP